MSMNNGRKNFFAIGHITDDLEPSSHLGGGVSYSGFVADRLGYLVHLITKCPPLSPYINELNRLGITVHRLPDRDLRFEQVITSFRNFYDGKGNRQQIVTERQEDITTLDLQNFPDIPENSVILIAPVASEINEELFLILAKKGELIVTPQGYFRKIEENGIVKRVPWLKVNSLRFAKVTILSDEDLTFDERKGMDEEYLQRIREYCPIVVLTRGKKGVTIFEKDKKPVDIKAFPLLEDELRDFTGAGDSFAAAFATRFDQTRDIKEAGIFAALYSAVKIAGKEGGSGLAGIPQLETVKSFVVANRERFNLFLRENGREGNSRNKERF